MKKHCPDYLYFSADPPWVSKYLWPPVVKILKSNLRSGSRILDIGCGNGSTAAMLAEYGFEVTGIDSSESGIQFATESYPSVHFAKRSVYDDLLSEFGEFDAVISLEVIEHCYWSRLFAETISTSLRTDGIAVISTPFHGYWKNLAIALTNKFDRHWSPLCDGGHIKFWSEDTLRKLLSQTGFVDIQFQRAGRISPIAKSMIAIAHKPR